MSKDSHAKTWVDKEPDVVFTSVNEESIDERDLNSVACSEEQGNSNHGENPEIIKHCCPNTVKKEPEIVCQIDRQTSETEEMSDGFLSNEIVETECKSTILTIKEENVDMYLTDCVTDINVGSAD